MASLQNLRNIGISAHIDSGKTTLSERILYYCNKIHEIHEVRGKDGVGATMDSMELERERGITIASAATNVNWKGTEINVIDTPGHVDFTIEVERSLRVLDGAVLVLCSVGGVQSQSITVDRQMKRYHVPRIAFINKCDRTGANPYRVKKQLVEKLGLNAVLMQIPIGLEDRLEGVVDLISMKALYFDAGENADQVREAEIPANLMEEALARREELLDGVSMSSDELMEAMLEDKVTVELLQKAIREATIRLELCPVFMGSAYKNKGIQPLLDAVVSFLPNPTEVVNRALDLDKNETEVILQSTEDMPPVILAFKLEDGQYGQLTYVRVYQGKVKKGDELYNTRSKKKFRVGRLIRMHAAAMEDLTEAGCGEIAALFGIECASGDTFCDPKLNYSLSSMYVPTPVISLAIKPIDKKAADNMGKALNRFTKEDPTFRSFVDPESNQTIIQGMGELHLEVYVERMKREYKAEVEVGQPEVAYREAITARADFNYTHKKQTGGSGQYARVAGYFEPLPDPVEGEEYKPYEFSDEVKGGAIPTEYIPSCDKGFQMAVKKGSQVGFPVIGVKAVVNDGAWHPVDSSDQAFQTAALGAFREAFEKAKPVILEPIMKVEVVAPNEFQGGVFASINQRRGLIVGSTEDNAMCTVIAEVPLAEMFGYSTVLRSLTQGKGEFTMELGKYGRVPSGVSEQLKKDYQEKRRKEQK
ncbi:elongation factor G [Sphaerochaeta globosa]|uniref:Elongation factor G n=1 Tax=Sphaerochaeta globosa (strain ATCC BAA-1886 / DSM 22777 / Buddy) TaxID=158189 RepID=F0RSH9_SPHGB|nr:elongation factor G [Sphaerochaeta globosa]ADY14092.1 translation elongation factor G [Sphaerochaeta globosa str. Buddy]